MSELLLFNTTENPYKRYAFLDPLLGTVTRTVSNETERKALSAAPKSLFADESYRPMQVRKQRVKQDGMFRHHRLVSCFSGCAAVQMFFALKSPFGEGNYVSRLC